MKWYQKFLSAFITNAANLLKVKTIITLSIVFTFCYLSLKGIISQTDFMVIATAVITYYFTKDNGKGEKKKKVSNEEDKKK